MTGGMLRRLARPAVILPLALVLMAAVQWRVPYLNEIGSHTIDALRIWRGQIDCAAIYRLPLGYAGYLSLFTPALGDAAGVKLANLVVFGVLLAAAAAWLARLACAAGKPADWTPLGQATLIAVLTLYPYMILDVARTNESMLAALILLALLWALFRRPTLGLTLFAAICIGFGLHVRANMISLLLPAVLWLLLRADGWPRRLALAATGLAATGAVYSLYGLLVAGCSWYTPTNGGYNLYAGNNPLSSQYLSKDQNAEYSIIPSLRLRGVEIPDVPSAYTVPQADYWGWTRDFVRDCPLCALKTMAHKTAIYFAPRLANAIGAEVYVQTALAAITWGALALLLLRFAGRRAYAEGMTLTVFAAYALPFALTNADPRLRFPLDVVALCYWVYVLGLWLGPRLSRRP